MNNREKENYGTIRNMIHHYKDYIYRRQKYHHWYLWRNVQIFTRNSDTFGYNERSEVVFSRRDAENAEDSYSYDNIGNLLKYSFSTITNFYAANNLNQYTSILCDSVSLREINPQYDIDGNLISDNTYSFTYDSHNRLKTVSSNGVLLVTNYYDAKSRRVKKVTQNATTTFFYDNWNLIEERVAYTNGTTSIIKYYWGKDLSGTLQGAGGVGGLLYLTRDDAIYIPCYDNNGNVTKYIDSNGNIVASYTYDAFGNLISKSGSLADFFRHRFSTKYFDTESNLYYYGYRFYHPRLMRWLNRDPIEENGGLNLYSAFKNQPICYFDSIGLEVFVVWHMPGDDFLYKWSKPDSAAETHFRASKPFVERIPCGFGKTAYKVTLTPPVSMIDVYFRRHLSPQEYWFARKFEEEHIALYVAYDKCIEEFKRRVESICACPADAVKAKKEAEDWLEERASYYIYKNKFLDRKGGPHGH